MAVILFEVFSLIISSKNCLLYSPLLNMWCLSILGGQKLVADDECTNCDLCDKCIRSKKRILTRHRHVTT